MRRNGGHIYAAVKRLADIAFAGIFLVLLSPLLILIAAAVAVFSPGPILYRGERTGRYGTRFKILKYRTMVVGADRGAGTTSRNDPRVSPIGAMLRRYKLDELPQLFNVLKGEMSVVGPRPELPRYTDLYQGEEKLILEVRPGITDLASLEFNDLGARIDDADPDRSFETEVLPHKNRLRVEYVRRRSFLLDTSLIFATVWVVIARLVRKRAP